MMATERHVIDDADAKLYPCSHYWTNVGPCREVSVLVYQIGRHGAVYGACEDHAERLLAGEATMTPKDRRRLALSDELNQMAHRVGSLSQRVHDVGDPGGAMTLAQTVAALRNIADGLEYGEDGNLIRTEVSP